MFYLDRVSSSLQLWGGQRVLEDEDDGVSPEEHLGDEAVLVHRLRLLLACKQRLNLVVRVVGLGRLRPTQGTRVSGSSCWSSYRLLQGTRWLKRF